MQSYIKRKSRLAIMTKWKYTHVKLKTYEVIII